MFRLIHFAFHLDVFRPVAHALVFVPGAQEEDGRRRRQPSHKWMFQDFSTKKISRKIETKIFFFPN